MYNGIITMDKGIIGAEERIIRLDKDVRRNAFVPNARFAG